MLALCVFCVPLREANAKPETDAAAATPTTKQNADAGDLGAGLHYFRVTNLSAQIDDLRAALAKHPALVVDLRGAEAGMAGARALRSALLPADAKARVARFVLINRTTDTAIPFTLNAGLPEGGIPGVLVIAPGAAGVPADVAAPGSVDDDRLACEAIANGVAASTLVNRQPEKKRYDEAALERERQGLPAQEDDGGREADMDKAGSAGKEAGQKTPVTDFTLQTAAQVHRALLALGKL